MLCEGQWAGVKQLQWQGGQGVSCGEMSGKDNFCVTCELNEHLFTHVTM